MASGKVNGKVGEKIEWDVRNYDTNLNNYSVVWYRKFGDNFVELYCVLCGATNVDVTAYVFPEAYRPKQDIWFTGAGGYMYEVVGGGILAADGRLRARLSNTGWNRFHIIYPID